MSAFQPGAAVTVIAIPEIGTNLELRLSAEQLAQIR
jgi:hypothetical protein